MYFMFTLWLKNKNNMRKNLKEVNSSKWPILKTDNYPLWLKLLSLAYVVFAFIMTYILFTFEISPNATIDVYGIKSKMNFFSLLLFIFIFILNFIAAYSILFEKKNAIGLVKFSLIIGIILSLYSIISSAYYSNEPFQKNYQIIIFIVIYYKISQIEKNNTSANLG